MKLFPRVILFNVLLAERILFASVTTNAFIYSSFKPKMEAWSGFSKALLRI